jgi:hypothetical protein
VLAFIHGLLLLLVPSIPLIALGLWWNTNTIGHNFIHLPFFRARWLNRLFAAYLSVVTGVPQRLWRERHLAHHRGVEWKLRWSEELATQALLVSVTWAFVVSLAPKFFLQVYIPGYLLGLALCHLQGRYEHARGTTSHYGWLYNLVFFNDGFHVEHHSRPGEHWTRLASHSKRDPHASRWPAVLRWLEASPLEALERVVLRSPLLQRFVLRCHERAWRALLPDIAAARRITILGGGLFPRTGLLLQEILPDARLTVVDAVGAHVETAKAWLDGKADYKIAFYSPSTATEIAHDSDMMVFPLSFRGARNRLYEQPPAPLTVVHDWIWRRRGTSAVVAWFLLKRINLVRG